MFFRPFVKVCMSLVIMTSLFSCSKKGDFIDEGKTGNGIHYYPVIANQYFVDTLTRKQLNKTDTTFSPDQQIIFEMDYFSKNKVESLELWAGSQPGNLKKALSIPYNSGLLSRTKGIDTILFKYRLPADLDSTSTWYIQPSVVTEAGLSTSLQAAIRIQ